MYSKSRIFVRGHNCVVSALFMVAASAMLPSVTKAGTYTWIGGNSGTWDKTSLNWSDGTTSGVAWQDGNDAVFNNTAAMTITVSGAISAANVTGNSTGNITFNGSGTLAWTGWLGSSGHVYLDCPLTDVNGAGLHFDSNGHVFFRNANNTHTGGTYFKNTRNAFRAFAVNAGDGALGVLPATAQNNIFAQGGNVALFVDNSYNVTLDAKRQILISDEATMFLSPAGTIRIKGIIRGANASNGYPTGTRICAHNQWGGLAILDPGAGKENYFGRLYVPARLEIASGTTSLITVSSGTGENAPLYIRGNGSAYSATRGYLLVSGGTLRNTQNRYFQIDTYGHLDIAGGTVSHTSGEILNAMYSPAKITIRNGGVLNAKLVRVSTTTSGDGGEIFIENGGTLCIGKFKLEYNYGYDQIGTVHFNGGKLQALVDSDPVIDNPTNAKWDNIAFAVEEGGAIFDTSNRNIIFWPRPLVSGAANDGGITVSGPRGLAITVAGSSYNGPTVVEEGANLRVQADNALPSGTTVRLAGGQVTFSTYDTDGDAARSTRTAQTVSRIEGSGIVHCCSGLTVANGLAAGSGGVLDFIEVCSLSGVYSVSGDAQGCGCLKFRKSGQSISGLTLNVADISAFDKDAARGTYKILDAPNGYTGTFAVGNVADPWCVKYTSTAAYIAYKKGTMLIIQ